jgi:glucose-1-phosphate cytidylyltransferase
MARGFRLKAVILAGGLGTRISEETHLKPKPMIEIGGKPILWHILKLYSAHGVNEFVICCGYKGYVIKEYFANYFLHMSDVTFDMADNHMEVHQRKAEPWRVTLVDTGEETATGGRLKRVARYIENDEAFCFTYGDGVSDVDITAEIAFHRDHGRLATIMAVQPPGRYGALRIENGAVRSFTEKPLGDGGYINGGFFVLSPKCLDLIQGDEDGWEGQPLSRLSEMRQLMAYTHDGFWRPMDTLRDKMHLEELWQSGRAPWKVWP